ncbi:MAG TPA: 3-phosphoserine/phosphohydroxythreonine transaminase [Firmicutes bacterium]|nr:3-phosphoserine/phosphohydroxythreonine transaminase [Bacillota bacterium]
MQNRVFNFYAGPATLPLPVLEEAQRDLLNFNSTGMSVLEISHRAKAYDEIHHETEARLKKLLKIGADFRVLFLQGGASTQFAMVPMNFLTSEKKADYIITGAWAKKAMKEAVRFGQVNMAASTEEENFKRVPNPEELKLSSDAAYVHLTSNNTIFGTQWQSFPDFGDIPIVADMSSDILSRPFNAQKFGLIYAGAQKNLAPAGVTVVIIRQDFAETANADLPTMLKYETHLKSDSLYNTPPSFNIYLLNLVLKWLENNGGLEEMAKKNQEKAGLIYEEIDDSAGYYRGHAEAGSRSLMNITFRLPNEELEKKFIAESTEKGLIGLKGHRSVGGLRASVYNAMPLEGAKALAAFMRDFRRNNK